MKNKLAALFALFMLVLDPRTAQAQNESMLEGWQGKLIVGVLAAAVLTIVALALLLWQAVRSRERLKRAKLENENLNGIHKAFLNASKDWFYLKDEQLRYVFVNRSMERFYGMPAEQIVGRDDFELSGELIGKLPRHTDLLARQKRDVIVEEVELKGRSLLCTKFPVLLPSGASGIGACIRDVTQERAEEKRREKAYQRQKILADVSSRSFQSVQEQLDYALHEALALTGSQYGYIFLYDQDKETFTLNAWTRGVMKDCAVVDIQTTYPLESTGIWGEVVRQKKPILVNAFEKPNPLKKGYPAGHVELKRFLSIPVFEDDRIVAAVGLANKPEDYDDLDVEELRFLMNGVWKAVTCRQLEDNVRFERTKYLKTLVSIGDGVMVVDGNGKVEMLNPVAERLTGWTLAEARGRHYREVFVIRQEEADAPAGDTIEEALRTGRVQELMGSAILASRQGAFFDVEDSAAPIAGEDGNVEGVVVVFRDVTHKKKQLRQIEHLSFHDALTGLYNRRFFNVELARLDTERNLPLSIMMGDVNGLKLTNDIFGHAAGDMLLQRIAQVLRRVCRADDIIARWGGDEFVLLLPKTRPEDAARIAARIKSEFSQEHIKAIKGSISMGVACKEAAREDISNVLSLAEEAMYSNKTLEQDEARNATIGEIIRTLHDEHPREREHAKNVSMLSQEIGRELKLSPEEIRKLKDAATLHDIGKIALEKDLLTVGRGATERQWNEIRRHPIIGYRILIAFDDTIDLAAAVLAHQEQWDGQGYPKGLKGEEIPIEARIIAVAEVYDRMLHEAVARPATKAEAIAFLGENAGTRFDPRVVEAFVRRMGRA